jgi:hypothetical protein
MTVGIAAIIDHDKSIVFATDQMVSVRVITADLPTFLKSFRFHNRWFAVYAGDVTFGPPIMRKLTAELSTSGNADIAEVCSAFVRVYREERERLAVQEVLSPFGLDMQTFINLLASNDTVELADMKRKIEGFYFDPEFLVGGFDPDGKAHLFTIMPPGVEKHYDRVRFWSIREGAEAAVNSILFRGVNPLMPLKQAIYHVAEAKFLSESTRGVGKHSMFVQVTPDGKFSLLLKQDNIELRNLWETEGQPPVPDNLDARVPDFWTPDDDEDDATQSDAQTSEGQP